MPHSKQTIERLSQVIRVLEELPKEKRFNMGYWMKCGTAGCAIGWAANEPWFTRRGLKLVPNQDWDQHYLPAYRGSEGFCAVGDFFDLDLGGAEELFEGREGNLTRRQVIANIKRFLRAP